MNKKNIIGYTTGVFDLFHVGHLNLLKQAKEYCDYLIVGVTTDELCMSRKEKSPVIPYEERAAIVENIKFVDEVVPQNDMDKFKVWEILEFHKMFVGDDWKGSEKWNSYEMQFSKVGVEIIYFPYTKNTSSTLLKKVLMKIS